MQLVISCRLSQHRGGLRRPGRGRGVRMGASALGTGTEEVMEGAVITALYGIFQANQIKSFSS